jgi:DNA-directed RNA polymerase subunit RPC12/RpoP
VRPFCAKCCREMHPTRNNRAVEIREQIYLGDEYTCDGCGAKIVTGFGDRPIACSWDTRRDYAAVRTHEIAHRNLLVEAA